MLVVFPSLRRAGEFATTVWQPAPDKPVQIFADQMSVHDANKSALFWGHILLTQGDVHLHCGQALVRYRAPAKDQKGAFESVECAP